MEISEDKFLSDLGIRIRQLREQREFSQQDLADYCEIPKIQIQRIELAKINTTIKTLVKIANALGVHPRDLFSI
ncbi:helix-turn-helix transcriptional regulator [Flavobacterium alkalisoli]|uniref:Helix-turn-helix transcriptional regulator n=1 Tax=Flavobacterium alkalisoli TaxID=2602769 RepID=A0A5B9FQP5_9FLAO|nr:helix-turn-helix transcriptional regulator [Flavobacterium alkalisoli]QEE49155.1 helix-turn-helix transcriptional regulator [Flavobacterium alkalisoli]